MTKKTTKRVVKKKGNKISAVSAVKPALRAPANLPVVTAGAAVFPALAAAARPHMPAASKIYPNTSQVVMPVKKDRSVIKSPRAAFYLGLTFGVVAMSLLVMITYYSILSNTYTYYLSQAL